MEKKNFYTHFMIFLVQQINSKHITRRDKLWVQTQTRDPTY